MECCSKAGNFNDLLRRPGRILALGKLFEEAILLL